MLRYNEEGPFMDIGGLSLAVLAAVFNGSFGSLSKVKPVKEAGVRERVKTLYKSVCSWEAHTRSVVM